MLIVSSEMRHFNNLKLEQPLLDTKIQKIELVQINNEEQNSNAQEKKSSEEIQLKEQCADEITSKIIDSLMNELNSESLMKKSYEQFKQIVIKSSELRNLKKDLEIHFPVVTQTKVSEEQSALIEQSSNQESEIHLSPNNLQSCGTFCTIDSVKDFISELCNIVQTEFSEEVIAKLNENGGPTSFQKLKMLELKLIDNNKDPKNQIFSENQIMSEEIFEKMKTFFFEDLIEENDSQEVQVFLQKLQKLHNRAVFDTFNEVLQQFRPWGIKNQPYPWNNYKHFSSRRKDLEKEDIDKVFELAKQKMLDYITTLCGFIHDKDECTFQISEKQLQHIKEDRMSKMLTQYLIDNDNGWVRYEDEEAEVGLEIADMVFENLIIEVIDELMYINNRKMN